MKETNILVPPGSLTHGALIELDESETHHVRVRRVGAHADVRLFDGAGDSASGALEARGNILTVAVGDVAHAPELATTLLAVGAGDKDRFLALAERCTELGVTRLVPLTTERSLGVDTRFRDSWVEKARRRAREACKQSGNPWATVVDEPCALEDLDERYSRIHWLVASFGGEECPRLSASESIGWIVGPEGGLSPGEIQFAAERLDATQVTFGPTILRFDTAAIAAAAITLDRRRARR